MLVETTFRGGVVVLETNAVRSSILLTALFFLFSFGWNLERCLCEFKRFSFFFLTF